MQCNARAPLRIGLAGGGTDVSPYTDQFGGLVINATVNLYANVSINPTSQTGIRIVAEGAEIYHIEDIATLVPAQCPPPFDLYTATLIWFANTYGYAKLNGLNIHSSIDVPIGSGLGTSSTLIVALIGALLEYHNDKLSTLEIAAIAFNIERIQLGHAGGRQDQYAASVGGLNAMYFESPTNIRIEPIGWKTNFRKTLESRLILYYTAHDRFSSTIIEEQIDRVRKNELDSVSAMHLLKKQAIEMREACINEDYHSFARLLDNGFKQKKRMASGISTPTIEKIYSTAINAGAQGGKISGAGGGGFMVFYCHEEQRTAVTKALCTFEGTIFPFSFTEKGMESWKKL